MVEGSETEKPTEGRETDVKFNFRCLEPSWVMKVRPQLWSFWREEKPNILWLTCSISYPHFNIFWSVTS